MPKKLHGLLCLFLNQTLALISLVLWCKQFHLSASISCLENGYNQHFPHLLLSETPLAQLASPPPALDPAAARVAALSVASAAVLSPAGSLLSAAGRTVSTVQGRSGVLQPHSPWHRQGLQVAMWKRGHRCHRLARGALISPLCPSFNVRLIKDSAKLINMPQIGFFFFFPRFCSQS